MPISFIVKKSTPPPPEETWYEATDNTYWQTGTESGGEGPELLAEWVSEGGYWRTLSHGEGTHRMKLNVKSGTNWAVDFRPTKIRITHTADVAVVGVNEVQIRTIVADIGEASELGAAVWSTFISPGIVELTFEGKGDPPTVPADIDIIWMGEENPSAEYTVTKIEFNQDPGEPFAETWYSVLKDDGTNDWWTVSNGTWNSEDNQWEFNDPGAGDAWFQFDNQGRTWGFESEFQPSKVRITGTFQSGTDPRVRVLGHTMSPVTGGNVVVSGSVTVLNVTFNEGSGFRAIRANGRDFGDLLGGYSIITNIEVNEDPGEVTLL